MTLPIAQFRVQFRLAAGGDLYPAASREALNKGAMPPCKSPISEETRRQFPLINDLFSVSLEFLLHPGLHRGKRRRQLGDVGAAGLCHIRAPPSLAANLLRDKIDQFARL